MLEAEVAKDGTAKRGAVLNDVVLMLDGQIGNEMEAGTASMSSGTS